MLTALLAIVTGLVLLTAGADQLVVGSGRLARRYGVSSIVVGVVIIGIGTSAPEFVVSAIASYRGDAGLAVGNLAGSNIINLTLVLGVAGLIAPVAVRSSVLRREAPLAVAAVVLFAVAAYAGLGRVAGALLAVAAAGALVLVLRNARVQAGDPMPGEVAAFLAAEPPAVRTGREAVRTLLGLGATLGGAQLLTVGGSTVAARLGVAPAVIGLTVVALGTSLPELFTTVQAQRRGDGDLLVGNLLGSNLFNSVAGGALVGLAGRGEPARLGYPVLAAMVAVALLSWLVLYRGYRVTRVEAGLLLVAYAMTLPLIA
ncbi:sodium:calcium antiporter [Dactylosporangium vinaceum]|uniref:Sodium:calcium antiporter n=1 Tax=Dactylosporangium vinaceum TaxID=53362 RepID=A0ABV5MKB8_9ACTN|nr:sodium:calcium antiporter [Dactylosporangium vinaceum]UAB99640.1 sodium:calcium antiporter [Dactylosporangium vinaceum]